MADMLEFGKYKKEFPRLTTIFETLEQNTKEGQFLGGDRSRGLEELLDYLAKREELFQHS
jgi:hypothetical protein